MKTVLITGGNGYLAKSIGSMLGGLYKITLASRNDLDVSDRDSLSEYFKDKKFDAVIHTAIFGGSRLEEDGEEVYKKNVLMFENIMEHKDKFDRFISFGSGAEIFSPHTPYGKSKKWIADRILQEDRCFNIRIFGVFDHNELPTRFIKSNIMRYIKRQPMIIHSNKIMDFYYMNDLVKIVEMYLDSSALPKITNCSYERKYSLIEIAKMINRLGTYTVPIVIEQNKDLEFYCGNPHSFDIEEIGVYGGIVKTYNSLNND